MRRPPLTPSPMPLAELLPPLHALSWWRQEAEPMLPTAWLVSASLRPGNVDAKLLPQLQQAGRILPKHQHYLQLVAVRVSAF